MACFFIGVSNINSEEIAEEEQERNKVLFVEYLKKINLFSLESVEQCARAIGEIYTREDEDESEEDNEDEFSGLLTRSNSTDSLDAIFANCDKKRKVKEDKVKLDEEFTLQLSGLNDNNREDNLKKDLLGKKRKLEISYFFAGGFIWYSIYREWERKMALLKEIQEKIVFNALEAVDVIYDIMSGG